MYPYYLSVFNYEQHEMIIEYTSQKETKTSDYLLKVSDMN